MATFTVTTAADVVASDGLRSLREAVAEANATAAPDTIVFSSSLEGKTLTLTHGELVLTQDVTIDGDQNNDGKEVTLSGGDHSRILHITGGGTDAQLRDLTLTHGRTTEGRGGAVLGDEGTSLRLDQATVRDNHTTGFGDDGGGISGDSIKLLHSTVSGNGTSGDYAFGGGIDGNSVTLDHSTVSGNTTSGIRSAGGGINGGSVTLDHSTVSGNSTSGGLSLNEYGRAGPDGGGINGYSVTVSNSTVSSNSTSAGGGGIFGYLVTLAGSTVRGNDGGGVYGYRAATITGSEINGNNGGGIIGGDLTVMDTSVSGNHSGYYGGGIHGGMVTVSNCTVAGNSTSGSVYGGAGGGIDGRTVALSNSTVTDNSITGGGAVAGGVSGGEVTLVNTIVAGNAATSDPEISGPITLSNGHNIFGSDVAGAITGDLEGIASSLLFAAIDPNNGGGLINTAGIVPLRNSIDNPALSAGDPLVALSTDQLGHARPQPPSTLPDIGAAERNQTLSTHPSPNNDVLTGTEGTDSIAGQGGSDLIRGLGGNDTLRGNAGSDLLDGGPGNDLLDGGDGIDLARFGGSTAVIVDMVAGTATRGIETDTLTSIQGAIGSSTVDAFKGDNGPNWFQGGSGRDVATGGAGRDLYDYDHTSDSLTGSASRDVITDFAHNSDKIDLTGIDADTTRPGNQVFHWVDTAALGTTPGDLGYFRSGGDTIVLGSVDGDSASEFQIQLTGIVNPTAADFFL